MVNMLAMSAVDRGFVSPSSQITHDQTGSSCFSAKNADLSSKGKDWLARNQDKDPPQRVGLVQSRHHHHLIQM